MSLVDALTIAGAFVGGFAGAFVGIVIAVGRLTAQGG